MQRRKSHCDGRRARARGRARPWRGRDQSCLAIPRRVDCPNGPCHWCTERAGTPRKRRHPSTLTAAVGTASAEIERPARGGVESGMMPMAGQNAIFDQAAMRWKTEIPTAVIERKNFVSPYMTGEGQTLPSTSVMPLPLSPSSVPTLIQFPAAVSNAFCCPIRTWRGPSATLLRLRAPISPARSGGASQLVIACWSECSLCADGGKCQRWSRFSSRPARRCRCNAIPRWFGLTVIPNCRDR